MANTSRLSVILALALVGCGREVLPPDGLVSIDAVTLTDAQLGAVVEAVEAWNATGATTLSYEIVHGGEGADCLVYAGAARKDRSATTFEYLGRSPEIALDFRVLPEQYTAAITIHELGHALGLHHLPTGVMQAEAAVSPEACVDALALSTYGHGGHSTCSYDAQP
jgi:hypothetical protein